MEQKGINFSAIPQTAIKVLTSPAAFFREMPKTGGFIEPLAFALVMGVIGSLIQAVLGVVGLRFVAGAAMDLASIILLPIFIVIGSFIGAAIMFVIWKILGSQESFETAYRCGAYITVLSPILTILGIIPYLGLPIGIVLMTFFIVMASVEVHNIPSQKAWLVFGIIGALLILLTVSSEFEARRVAREATKFQKEMEKASKEMQKQAEEMQKQAEEAQKAAEELQKQLQKQFPAK